MLAQLLIVLVSINLVYSKTCSYSNGTISANWKYSNGAIQINFQNSNLQNNQWTAIAFGQTMQNLSVIIFEDVNNQITVKTGVTRGYGPPTLDSSLQASPQSMQLSGNTLKATVNVPLTFDTNQVSSCQTWHFVVSGPITNGQIGHHTSLPLAVNNVCPVRCR